MGFVDLILNILAVWFLVSWRMNANMREQGYHHSDLNYATGALVVAGRTSWWRYLKWMLIIILGRPFLYLWLGNYVHWYAVLKFVAVNVPFPPGNLSRMFLFSISGFLQALLVFYVCLLFLTFWNRDAGVSTSNQMVRCIHMMLGKIVYWPAACRLLLPMIVAIPLWFLYSNILMMCDVLPPQRMFLTIFRESLVMGLAVYVPWFYLMALLIFIHAVSIFNLGTSPAWSYLHGITEKVLKPLYYLPLKFGKVDFVPVAGLGIVFLLSEYCQSWLMALFVKALG